MSTWHDKTREATRRGTTAQPAPGTHLVLRERRTHDLQNVVQRHEGEDHRHRPPEHLEGHLSFGVRPAAEQAQLSDRLAAEPEPHHHERREECTHACGASKATP